MSETETRGNPSAGVRKARESLEKVTREVHRVIVGQEEMVEGMLTALLCGGHVLLEGVPGLAKTLCATTLAGTLRAGFQRVQFTPDLLPGDLVGSEVFNPRTGEFYTRKGPIFTQVLLADEINRAPAKVQSALLEAMQEKQVTIGQESYPLDAPFFVIATENPIEQEGTYPLPEAQVDRFFLKLLVEYPRGKDELTIVDRMATTEPPARPEAVLDPAEVLEMRRVVDRIRVEPELKEYALRIVRHTRPPLNGELDLDGLIEWGASPRATIYLVMAARARALLRGREYVIPDDLKEMAPAVLRHRLILSFEAEAEGVEEERVIDRILSSVPAP